MPRRERPVLPAPSPPRVSTLAGHRFDQSCTTPRKPVRECAQIDQAKKGQASRDDPEETLEGSAEHGNPIPAAECDNSKTDAAGDERPGHPSCALTREVKRHAEAVERVERGCAPEVIDANTDDFRLPAEEANPACGRQNGTE